MAGMSPVPAESKIPAGPNGYVQDVAGVLNGMEISVLEEPLADYKKKTQQRIDRRRTYRKLFREGDFEPLSFFFFLFNGRGLYILYVASF